jgi:hypothetical protein
MLATPQLKDYARGVGVEIFDLYSVLSHITDNLYSA